jgi:hypothetical protein
MKVYPCILIKTTLVENSAYVATQVPTFIRDYHDLECMVFLHLVIVLEKDLLPRTATALGWPCVVR